MPWFAIRSVYLFGRKNDGTNIYEERVVAFEADSTENAHARAAIESDQYAVENGFEAYPHQVGYRQDDDALIDGYELWSAMFESSESLSQFYENRYRKCEYMPDPS